MANSIVPLGTASSITPRVMTALARLRELPASAPIVHRALVLLENPDFVIAELKKTLLSDPAIAARVLRLANSAYFGFRSEVQTVSQAIILLGQHRIRTVLQRILVDKLLSDLAHGRSAASPLRKLALATATASCTLSQLLLREDAEEMMLAGLLHNIGDLFFLSQFPAEYAHASQMAEQLGRQDAMMTIFGLAAGQAGKLLLENWRFPPLYTAVVEHVEEPFAPACPPEFATPIALVYAGVRLARPFVARAPVSEAIQRVPADVCELLGLDAELLTEVYQTLPQRMSLEQLQAAR